MTTATAPERAPRTRTLALATLRQIARARRVDDRTVHAAIADGRLPAYVVPRPERPLYLIRPEDAEAIWPDKPRPDPLPELPAP
ncbi:MAG: hypothetical protein KDB70_03980 [Mycobacterium sp.]|nr:hypothetical protein [Mycobacterium sp.]